MSDNVLHRPGVLAGIYPQREELRAGWLEKTVAAISGRVHQYALGRHPRYQKLVDSVAISAEGLESLTASELRMRVQDLRRDAEAQFRITEQQLTEELNALEAKLAEMQAERQDGASLVLSPEQAKEIDRFQDERLRIRKELRQVQRDLDQSIEDLGMRLKVINIFLVPVLLAVLGLIVLSVQRRRRS